MTEPAITPQLVQQHNLTPEEFARIQAILGRDPSYTELGIFSVMWSEHCSYKNTRPLLKTFPTKSPKILVGAGEENAGIIDIGDGLAIAFKIESHNHPSAVEPFQGAATGVGGIVRDIFTMGARPVAAVNSLRFGPITADGGAGEKGGKGERQKVSVAVGPPAPQPPCPPAERKADASPDILNNRRLFSGVVSGIAHYGNCFGIPTIAGEVYFDKSYEGNPLVNAFCLGVLRHEQIVRGAAKGVGNPVFYVGPATGRDGLAGAAFASQDLTDESAQQQRGAVQVGDPFMEKLVCEACLELLATGAVAGIQDMGAAGLTCSTCETAARAGTGIEIELNKVPQRAPGMTSYEIMLSESQERMLIIVTKGREEEVKRIFDKWDLPWAQIGIVTDTGRMVVKHNGRVVADIPAKKLADEAPVYQREAKEPAYVEEVRAFRLDGIPDYVGGVTAKAETGKVYRGKVVTVREFGCFVEYLPGNDGMIHISEWAASRPNRMEDVVKVGDEIWVKHLGSDEKGRVRLSRKAATAESGNGAIGEAQPPGVGSRSPVDDLKKLLAWPSIASKNWVYRQYDHMVRDGTVVCPGSDAAVLRIKADSLPESDSTQHATRNTPEKFIALTVDCNGAYVYLDPYEGGKIAVTEACRNLACAGAAPLGVTDNLNMPSPLQPELFWQIKESVRGLAEACRAFNAPVTGGNCSLYNQSPAGPIDPTPTVAVVGLIEKPEHVTTQWFKDEGDAVILLGQPVDTTDPLQGLGGSACLQVVHGRKIGSPPRCDLEVARTLHTTLLGLIQAGGVKSAHDCSEGGLAVALAECCISQQLARETPRLIGAQIDLSAFKEARMDALLFGETQNRVVITTKALDAVKVIERAKLLGVPAARIGTVGGDRLGIKTVAGAFSATVADLHDCWWNAIARAMA
jgi:phosphoribosylformylglycinamidine synthase